MIFKVILFALIFICLLLLKNVKRKSIDDSPTNETWQVGIISRSVINRFNLTVSPNTPVYISTSNVEHIKEKHPHDWEDFFSSVDLFLKNPQNVIERRNGTIFFIRFFLKKNVYVKVVVRPTSKNVYFLRTMYKLSNYK